MGLLSAPDRGAARAAADAEDEQALALAPAADASVDRLRPNRSFGMRRALDARRGRFETHLRFKVPGGLGDIHEAELRLHFTNGSGDGLKVRATHGWWREDRVRWRSRPDRGRTLTSSGPAEAGSWAALDLTGEVTSPGTLALGIVARGRDRARFASREGPLALRPQLVIRWLPLPLPGPGSAVVAAAGDIACDPSDPDWGGGAGTAARCRQMATSDLLVGGDHDAVLALGDTQYETGALPAFDASYDPSWGRVKGVTRPAVGNHEYGTADAAGYFTYFGAAAGDPSQGWYSFDLGAWHLVALNSECGEIGGCAAGSLQEQWLRADLAASGAACTLAYWHRPRWSSGSVHGSDAAYAAFWEALADHGADLVLNGHDHVYERFVPLRPDGVADQAAGIRQFTVGTGGKEITGFGDPLATSERRGTDLGVLRLTLRQDGYDWLFLPAAGGSFSDGGSGACH